MSRDLWNSLHASGLTSFLKHNKCTLFVSLLLGALFCVAIWNADAQPFCWDEAAHALYAREIARDFFYVPHLQLWPRTPPFFHTIEGLGFKLFGEAEIVGRLISAFSFVLTLGFVYKLSSRAFSPLTGLLAVFLLGLNYHFLGYSRMGMAYGMVTFLDTMVIYLFYVSTESRASKRLLLAGLFLGLSFVTKFSGVFPFLAGLLYLVVRSSSLNENNVTITISTSVLKYSTLAIVVAVFVVFSFLHVRIGAVIEYLLWDANSLLFTPSLAKGAYEEFHPIMFVLERLGIYVSAVCLLGILYSILRRTKEDLLFLCWGLLPISALLVLASQRFAMRYYIPFFPPMFILGARFASDIADSIGRSLAKISKPKIVESLKASILLLLIAPQLVLSSLQIPALVASEVSVDGYWFIHGYKEAGLFFRENTPVNVTIATNTHQPVLKFYCQRNVSQPISATSVEKRQYDFIVIHASPELAAEIGPFEQGIFRTIQDPEPCLDLVTSYPLFSATKAYAMVRTFDDEQGNVIVWIFEKDPALILVVEAEHSTVSAGVHLDKDSSDDSQDSMTLDFENEWIKFEFEGGSYLVPGEYRALVRARDLNQVEDDFAFVLKDFTEETDISERVLVTLDGDFAEYSVDFGVDEEDLAKNIGFWMYKRTTNPNTIWVDYFMILRKSRDIGGETG